MLPVALLPSGSVGATFYSETDPYEVDPTVDAVITLFNASLETVSNIAKDAALGLVDLVRPTCVDESTGEARVNLVFVFAVSCCAKVALDRLKDWIRGAVHGGRTPQPATGMPFTQEHLALVARLAHEDGYRIATRGERNPSELPRLLQNAGLQAYWDANFQRGMEAGKQA